MIERRISARWLAAATLFLVMCAPLQAHHGSAMTYDVAKTVTLKNATVTQFAWINPHVLLYVNSEDGRGNVTHWICEFTGPGVLSHSGWTRAKLKPGDKITLTMHPALSGAPLGLFNEITFSNGTKFSAKNIK